MSVTKRVENLVINAKLDESTEKFQRQYNYMLEQGLIQRKGYNLANLNVIGHKTPSTSHSNITALTSSIVTSQEDIHFS